MDGDYKNEFQSLSIKCQSSENNVEMNMRSEKKEPSLQKIY